MAPDNQPPAAGDARHGNRVLGALRDEDFERLRPHLEPFEMQAGDVLAHAGETISHIYFLESGGLSMLATTTAGSTVEVAFVGREGLAGGAALLGGRTLPYGLVAQLPGRGWRVRAEAMRDELLAGGQLLAFLHHYVQILVAQITQAAVCNRFHSPRQRLSRWLAHLFDRAGGDTIAMTHEFAAMMIGGARSLVTQASTELRDLGVIEYQRGRMRLLDPRRLHEQACECYSTVAALMGDPR